MHARADRGVRPDYGVFYNRGLVDEHGRHEQGTFHRAGQLFGVVLKQVAVCGKQGFGFAAVVPAVNLQRTYFCALFDHFHQCVCKLYFAFRRLTGGDEFAQGGVHFGGVHKGIRAYYGQIGSRVCGLFHHGLHTFAQEPWQKSKHTKGPRPPPRDTYTGQVPAKLRSA